MATKKPQLKSDFPRITGQGVPVDDRGKPIGAAGSFPETQRGGPGANDEKHDRDETVTQPHPLDHDADGKKGGSLSGDKATAKKK